MAFCSFDGNATLYDSTPVENMFIAEMMPGAPGDYVKVYLTLLMYCYHPRENVSLEQLGRDLHLDSEELNRALHYWEKNGLLHRVSDEPAYTVVLAKQRMMDEARGPEQLYNRSFTEDICRVLGRHRVTDADLRQIFDWEDVYGLSEEVILMLLQNQAKVSGGRVSMRIAGRIAREWAQSGVRTVEDAERIVLLGQRREKELQQVLVRLGQRRKPSEDEKELYRKWVEDWGFSADSIQDACRETTKGAPTMAYLDRILLRQHQMGIHEAMEVKISIDTNNKMRDRVKKIFAGLGITGVSPSPEDMKQVEAMVKQYGDEMVDLSVIAVHGRRLAGNLEDVADMLDRWRSENILTPEDVRREAEKNKALNVRLRQIFSAAGTGRMKPTEADRKMLRRWREEYGMDDGMIDLAAAYAGAGARTLRAVDSILSQWNEAGIHTREAAMAEHDARQRGTGSPVNPQAEPALLRSSQEREESYQATLVNFDEEFENDERQSDA